MIDFMNMRGIILLSGLNALLATSSLSAPAVDVSELDSSVRPQDDFWSYVNGRWVDRTEIPADKARWGSFDSLAEQSRENVRTIIEDLSKAEDLKPGTPAQQIRDLFNGFMDTGKLNALGAAPIESELAEIDAILNREELVDYLAHMARLGISHPVGLSINQDLKKPDEYVSYIGQSGLGLPDRDYYFEEGDRYDDIRAKYLVYAETLFKLADIEDGAQLAQAAYDFEKQIAEPQWTRVQNRDREKTYNKFSRPELAEKNSGFLWARYWDGTGLGAESQFVVRQPDYLERFASIFAGTDLATWKAYLKLRVLDNAAAFLSDAFFDASFEFYSKTLSGTEAQEERWKRGVNLVNALLGEAVGQEYVKRHFPPEAKARMLELVNNLNLAMADSIGQLEWMAPETKVEARKKLAKFSTKIGYPDKWKDYSGLEIVAGDLIGNLRQAAEFEHNREINKLGKPIDRGEWFMTPQTVNAYYNPSMNEIVFPAAILQPPFFGLQADDAVNYGGIGVVIGHEIGHGYDDQGRKSDGDGMLRDWWTEHDAEEYQKRTAKLVEQFDGYSPVEGSNVNGQLTLGENIGDLGGMTLSWRAYQKSLEGKPAPDTIDSLSAAERFFISYAQIWRSKSRDAYMVRMLKTNPHSPPEFRVKGPLANFAPFYETFGIAEGDGMFLDPKKRVSIW